MRQFHYGDLGKPERGVIRRLLARLTNYSPATLDRLVQQYKHSGQVRAKPRQASQGFRTRYRKDIRQLARMDKWHQQPNGMALRKLCERAHQQGESGFEWLAQVSVAHLYRLRQSETYTIGRQLRKTRPTSSPIGQRQAPEPNGQPSYLRMDTVHQGDRDKRKGVYYINAVDQETQYEVVMAVAQLREGQVHSALQHMMEQFPFRIRGVHTDNDTEYVNHTIGDWLQQSGIDFTRSRPRRSNDNGLVGTSRVFSSATFP